MMERRSFVSSALGALAFAIGPHRTAFAAPFDSSVSPLPTPVSQGNANLCWLAASAVMFSYKDSKPYSLTDAATRLGGVYVIKQVQGLALQYDELKGWLQAGGFKSQGQQCLDSDGWAQLLKSRGPLITLVDGSGDGVINHSVVVLGVVGDGTQDGTTITFANGQSGKIEASTLAGFAAVFELASGTDVLFSVAHFG